MGSVCVYIFSYHFTYVPVVQQLKAKLEDGSESSNLVVLRHALYHICIVLIVIA